MKYDIVLTGVGGQGIVSIAAIIAGAAVDEGLEVIQSEVHGMSQRGGSVVAYLRLADHGIGAPTVAAGRADLVIAAELLEGLRCLRFLHGQGTLLAADTAVENMANYPDRDELRLEASRFGRTLLFDPAGVAGALGSPRAANTVLLGAASSLIPVGHESLLRQLDRRFARKGERVVDDNRRAFAAGREAIAACRT